MKKMIFSASAFALVAVSSMALAPTTAEAIPAFARQTGAACLSCHFQTFPAINSFGRAFKMGSFTDVGDQALIEDDGLSIPSSLNASVVIRGDFTQTSAPGATASNGVWNLPSETPILIAGRVGSNSGAFVEFGNSATGTVGVGNWQFIHSVDVGDFKVGGGGHNSTFGASAIMEISNVFGQHGGKLGGANVSAMHNMGFRQALLGVGAWVGNDLGVVQFSLVAPQGAQGTNVGTKFGKLVRVIATLDVGGWDTLIGFSNIAGSAGKDTIAATATTAAVTGAGVFPMNWQSIDVQLQGEVGDMSIGIYGDWAQAKGKTSSGVVKNGNIFGATPGLGTVNNLTGTKTTGFSLRGEVKPMEHILFGIGFGSIKQQLAATNPTIKQFQLAATYEIYQNLEINLIYNTKKDEVANGIGTGATKTTTVEFEALM
ncbi:MAG: hypothetical protein Q9M25_04290 [Mariprofundaceae bacterium]|nr:hypothetical protein [Mariprofundaceae bacterium]